ncbi:MAG: HAMP domain-containing sensor histidine kinase [Cyanobacteria bacterium J06597_1]
MAEIALVLLGLGLGLAFHVWWRRQLLDSTKPLLQKLGVSGPFVETGQVLQQKLNVAVERFQHDKARQEQLDDRLGNSIKLQQSLPLGFIQLDRYNRLLQCNPAAKDLFNISDWQPNDGKVLLEWVRSYDLDLLVQTTRVKGLEAETETPPDVQASSESFDRQNSRFSSPPVEPQGQPQPMVVAQPEMRDWLFYPPDGRSKPIPLRGWGVPLSGGQVGVLIEDRRETTDLAQQRNRWASDVAHELKTPLTSIRLVAETLQQRVDPSLRKWVDRLLNEILRLSDLVQDLLELSRLDLQTSSALQVTNLDLVEAAFAAWRSLEPLSGEKRQTLDYSGPRSFDFCGDRSRIHRLFLNVLDNAIKYSPVDTEIFVAIEAGEEEIVIEICDRGSGFTPEALERIFERFYRTDAARARSQGGSGLGLAIAKQIVEVHGGQISARNHPTTGGGCLRFSLSRNMSVSTRTGIG